jgi:hypothetical protein
VEEVEVVVAHRERATLRVGDRFLKIDGDPTRIDREVEAMALAPVPTPEVLWREPGVLALAALRGTALGHLGAPSTSSPETWVAVGAVIRELHDAPLPPWIGRSVAESASQLADECEWLVANEVLPVDVVTRNRRLAEQVLRPCQPVLIHGDLQASSTGPRRARAMPSSTSPRSRSDIRSISTTSSRVTAARSIAN